MMPSLRRSESSSAGGGARAAGLVAPSAIPASHTMKNNLPPLPGRARSRSARTPPRGIERFDAITRSTCRLGFRTAHALALGRPMVVVSREVERAVDHEAPELATETDSIATRLREGPG